MYQFGKLLSISDSLQISCSQRYFDLFSYFLSSNAETGSSDLNDSVPLNLKKYMCLNSEERAID